MNTKKATKRALLTSVMALVMCVVMLVGTTFAWFTDTASTGVNKIVAGNLKVDIVDADNTNTSLDKGTLKFIQAVNESEVRLVEDVLWEPGATFFTQGFRIANKGNLALKYKVVVSGTTGDTGLLKVMKFDVVSKMEKTGFEVNFTTTPGQLLPSAAGTPSVSDIFYLRGHMDENAGNEYKNMTLTGISVTVHATQLNSEFDSFDKDYDKDADYSADVWDGTSATADELAAATSGTTVTIKSGKLLAALAEAVNDGNDYDGYTIKLTKNLDLNGNEWTPIGQKNGNKFKGTFDGQGYTVTGLKISEKKAAAFDGYVAFFGATDSATIKNLTVAGSVTGNDAAGIVGKGVNTTLENCHNKATITATVKAAGIVASLDKGTLKNCTNSGAITTTGTNPAAGIVAWCNPGATIVDCQNSGAVTVTGSGDSSQAGGICGNLGNNSTVTNCSNSGKISASLAGGVAGRAKGAAGKAAQIVSFTNTGEIVASNFAGGVVGDAQNGVTAESCTIKGTVSGTNAAGGIFGTTQGNSQSAVKDCTINANVTATTANRAGQVVGILGGKVELKLDESTANDIGCFKGATLTITGKTPNNIDFSEIVDGSRSNPVGFVHENIGLTETIIIGNVTYYYHGTATDPYYTWSVTNS